MLRGRQGLGQDIRDLGLGGNVFDDDEALLDGLTGEVKLHVNVLGALVVDRISREPDAALVILKDNSGKGLATTDFFEMVARGGSPPCKPRIGKHIQPRS